LLSSGKLDTNKRRFEEEEFPSDSPQFTGDTQADIPTSQMWEYKSCDTSNAQVFGPFTTEQMIDWQNQNYFQGDTVMMVRKVNSGESFQRSDSVNFTQ